MNDSTAALVIGASAKVRFAPALNYNGTPPALQIRVLDSTYAGGVSASTGGETRFTLDVSTRTVTGPDGEVALTRKEFDLLVTLVEARGAVVTRDALLDRVWGDVVVDVHTVDNFVSSLKKKLKAGAGAFELKTVRGVGFRLVVA